MALHLLQAEQPGLLQPKSLSATPAPLPDTCWEREVLIRNGYTPGRLGRFGDAALQFITSIVWHDMEGWLPGAISRWNTGAAGAHLCVLRDGERVLTCPLENTAWHAGTDGRPASGVYGRTPFWRTHNVNPYSVGIELEGFAASGYTEAQAQSCGELSDWLTARFPAIPREHTFDQIAGHHAHGELSSSRSDPGPLFDWGWVL